MFPQWFQHGLSPWERSVIIPRDATMPEWGWRERDQEQCEGKAAEPWNLVEYELLCGNSLSGAFLLFGFGFYFTFLGRFVNPTCCTEVSPYPFLFLGSTNGLFWSVGV